jgi:DNA-binding NarL/FixJ family response regulator
MSHPAISVVVMSAQQDYNSVVKALDQGARGFIPKSATRKVILGAVQFVIRGGVYIPPLCPSLVFPGPEQAPQRPVSPADLGLTERQMEVLTLIMQGNNNKAICRVLDLSKPTVKNHISAIARALKVSNRIEIVIAMRKPRNDGDLPEAPSPAVPPSPTRGLGPQGETVRIVPEEP